MFTTPDADTTTALARMSRTAEWELVQAWLLASREQLVQASFAPDDVRSRQCQGGAKAIDELLKNTRSAAELSARR